MFWFLHKSRSDILEDKIVCARFSDICEYFYVNCEQKIIMLTRGRNWVAVCSYKDVFVIAV